MSDADMPRRPSEAIRWVLTGTVLFVSLLESADDINVGRYGAAALWGLLFLADFVLLLVWNKIAWIGQNWRAIAAVFAALAWAYLAYQNWTLRSDLDSYAMPRVLTPHQAARLTDYLRKSPKTFAVEITADPKDGEAWQYASQFQEPLNNAGWKAVWNPWQAPRAPDAPPLPPGSPPVPRPPVNEGVSIGAPIGNGDDTGRKTLARALQSAGIENIGCEMGSDARLILLIGHRPMVLGDQRPWFQRWYEGSVSPCG